MADPTWALQQALSALPACPPPVEDLLAASKGEKWAGDVLRDALRHKLDIRIQPVVRTSKSQHAMSRDHMKAVYTRRREHILGYTKTLKWALVQTRMHAMVACPQMLATGAAGATSSSTYLVLCEPPAQVGGLPPHGIPPLQTPSVAYSFWHSLEGSPKMLPRAYAEGLASCVANSGLTVVLLTYQGADLAGVPAGVQVLDASCLLALHIFNRLLHRETACVQHLADYVRLLALVRGAGGLSPGGWLIDGDTIWFRRAPKLSVARPPNLGHWFACQHAAVQTRVAGKYLDKQEAEQHWSKHYLVKPGDFLHIAFPMAVPANSPMLQEVVHCVEEFLFGGLTPGGRSKASSKTSAGYNSIMAMCQAAVHAWGLEDAIADIAQVAPLHRIRAIHAGATKKRHIFGDLSKAIRDAVCANNIWQSTMHAEDTGDAFERANRDAEEGSAWAEMLEAARTGVRRRLTTKTQSPAPAADALVACPQQEVARPQTAATPPRGGMSPAVKPRSGGMSPAVKTEDKCVGETVNTEDKCVGDSVWGDPFVWRTIFDDAF